MQNRVILTGNLGRDPEIQVDQNSKQIAKFSLATSSVWKDKNGEWHKRTQWHSIIVFKETTVRWIKDVLKKGTRVRVEGSLIYYRTQEPPKNSHKAAHVSVSGQYDLVEVSPYKDSGLLKATGVSEEYSTESLDLKDLDQEEDPFDYSQTYQQSQQN